MNAKRNVRAVKMPIAKYYDCSCDHCGDVLFHAKCGAVDEVTDALRNSGHIMREHGNFCDEYCEKFWLAKRKGEKCGYSTTAS